jgi:hypothetical protein
MLMWIDENRPTVPALINGKLINTWSWDNLVSFIGKL